jgi:hypothetical protein
VDWRLRSLSVEQVAVSHERHKRREMFLCTFVLFVVSCQRMLLASNLLAFFDGMDFQSLSLNLASRNIASSASTS